MPILGRLSPPSHWPMFTCWMIIWITSLFGHPSNLWVSACGITAQHQRPGLCHSAHQWAVNSPPSCLPHSGDFNHANPKSMFPKLHGHVNFPTRGTNILNNDYTSHRGAHKSFPLPWPWGQEYTENVTTYMRKWIHDVTVTRTIHIRANQKTKLTGEGL